MNEARWRECGIDYMTGLRQFVGNSQIYEKYLANYRADRHCEAAMNAYRRGDMNEVLKQVHALKGLSSTLGMTELFNACSEVVVRLRGERYGINNSVLSYEMEQIQHAHDKALMAVNTI